MMVKLRFLLAWGNYPKGFVIEPPATLRQQLLATRWYGRSIVEVVEEPKPAPEPEPQPAPAGRHARQRTRASL